MIKLKTPGMRTIKTSLVVAICLILSKLLNINYPYYAAVSGIICIQNTVHGSIKIAKNRIIGTIIGSLLGTIFVYSFSYNPWSSGIGIFILLYLLNVTNLKESYVVACIVYLATFIPGHGPAIAYGLDRTIATIIGILTALIVNSLLSPPQYSDDIRKYSDNLIDNLFRSCRNFFILDKEIEILCIGSQIVKIEELMNNYKIDIKQSKIKDIDTIRLDSIIMNSRKIYIHMGVINELNKLGYNCNLNEENSNRISDLYKHDFHIVTCGKAYHNEVFNYHIEQIINCLDCLKNRIK